MERIRRSIKSVDLQIKLISRAKDLVIMGYYKNLELACIIVLQNHRMK